MIVLPFIMLIEALFTCFIGVNYEIGAPTVMALAFIAINSVVFFLETAYFMKHSRTLFTIISVSYFLRISFMFFDIYGRNIFLLPGSGADTEVFHSQAVAFAQTGQEGITNYVSFIGWIYRLVGSERIFAQYVNVILSILTIFIAVRILEKLRVSERAMQISIFILAFLPNYMIISAILLRESLLIFLLALSLLLFVNWWTENRVTHFLLSLVFVLFAAYFHSGAIANGVVYVVAFILCNNPMRKFQINRKSVILSVVFLAAFSVFFNKYGSQFFDYFASIDSAEDVAAKNEQANAGGAAYNAEIVSNDTFFGMIINTPVKIMYFLFSPFPWDWRDLNDMIAFIFSSVFFLVCLIMGVRALLRKDFNQNMIWLLLFLALVSAVIFGWGTSNAGTALRHRDKFLVNYIVMLAISLNALSFRYRRRIM